MKMIEPTDPAERAKAIRICRANAHLDADTGKLDKEKSRQQWDAEWKDLPESKWLWMWNYGRKEWDPDYKENR